jgi:serine/alanine adding enzyme
MLVQLVTRIGAPPLAVIEPENASWDSFVGQHHAGHLLQSAGWAVLKRSNGWTSRRIAVLGQGGIQAGAQLLIKRRFGVSVAYVPRGPLFAADPAVNAALLDALTRIARQERAVFLRLEPNVLQSAPDADTLHTWLLTRDARVTEPLQPRSSVHLNVRAPSDVLLGRMSKGHRADVKRAAREGVQVRIGRGPADIDTFYAILQETSARAGFGIHPRDYYAAALRTFADCGALWLAEQEGVPQAAAITARWGDTALYLYSGSTTAGLRVGAQHAIQWAAIQWAAERGAVRYDLWGVPDQFGQAALAPAEAQPALEEQAKTDPLYGIYRFKKGFGGEVVRYLPAYDLVFIPLAYRMLKNRI